MNDTTKELLNPWRNGKTLQFAIDNYDDFRTEQEGFELINTIEMYEGQLSDALTYANSNTKAINWALENYDDLEFEFEHNPSWYYNNKQGQWAEHSPSSLQKEAGADMNFSQGIEICTLSAGEEIELQAENGESAYISTGGYLTVYARLN